MLRNVKTDLALFGGAPAIQAPLAPFNRIGAEEKQAVAEVMETGVLSGFVGAPGAEFDGGPKVHALEAAWRVRFGVPHAVTMNSATSGLFAAVGASGAGPGDEVITSPYSMSATAMAPLVYGATPVFADIDPETFCLDPARVSELITPRTRAIIAVNLFGQAAPLHKLRELADAHGLALIEDNAQGPLAEEDGALAGTIGHIGVFSLNRHKHIHTGEGGVCCTRDENLALRLRLIRNHGENLIESFGVEDASNLIGFNYRLSELASAIGVEQLRKLEGVVEEREHAAARLNAGIAGMQGIAAPLVRPGNRHVYYCWTPTVDAAVLGVSRDRFAEALQAEGAPIRAGYLRPLYELPLFQRRVAMGRDGFPFAGSERGYAPGLCPVCEDLENSRLLTFLICSFDMSDADVDLMLDAFGKVYERRHQLV